MRRSAGLALIAFAMLLSGCGSLPAPERPVRPPPVTRQHLPPPMAGEIAIRAVAMVGKPYRTGGASIDGGFDCSGFVQSVYREGMGVTLPRLAADQAAHTFVLEQAELAPGDLVFFNTQSRPHSHVGIYVGEGRFVHSPKPGGSVRIESLGRRYWQDRFDGARRVTASARS